MRVLCVGSVAFARPIGLLDSLTPIVYHADNAAPHRSESRSSNVATNRYRVQSFRVDPQSFHSGSIQLPIRKTQTFPFSWIEHVSVRKGDQDRVGLVLSRPS